MKRGTASLFFILTTFVLGVFGQKAEVAAEKKPATPALPSVKQVLDKYVTAIGGREAYLKIKSRSGSGTIEIPAMGIKGSFDSLYAPDAKMYMKMTIPGLGDMLEGSDGKTSWAVNPIQGSRTKAGKELAQGLLSANFYKDINLDTVYTKLEVVKKDKVNDRDVYVVKATKDDLPEDTYYFDAENGLLVRTDSTAITPEGQTTSSSYYEDYREADGVKIPQKLRIVTPQFQMILTITSLKNNVEVDETKFAMPK